MTPPTGGSNDIYFVSLALFGAVWAIFAVPFAYHCVRAARSGNCWLPFEPKPGGGYTFMTRNPWFAAFRAPAADKRTTRGLVVRYGIWLWVAIALAYLPVRNLIHILTR